MRHLKNEVWIALLAITAIALISSLSMVISSSKQYAEAYRDTKTLESKVPFLTAKVEPYSEDQYKVLYASLNLPDAIRANLTDNNRIVITAANIADESKWRQAISDVLALDPNLHTQKVCGNVANTCTGAALVAEIVGSRQVILIKE